MFNFCVFSGQLCHDPHFATADEKELIVSFDLAVSIWEHPVGKIRVHCYERMAVLAANHLQSGDRVAVLGFLRLGSKEDGEEGQNDTCLIAIHLELIRRDDQEASPSTPSEGSLAE